MRGKGRHALPLAKPPSLRYAGFAVSGSTELAEVSAQQRRPRLAQGTNVTQKTKAHRPLYRSPRGTSDVLPADQPYRRLVRETAERVCRAFGSQSIDTPAFADARLVLRGVGG